MEMTNQKKKYEISAAIDFGTTFSAIAYSYDFDKEKIYVVSQWPDGTVSTKYVNKHFLLQDTSGKTMKAIDVFGGAIGFMKDHLINLINERNSANNITVESIRWVLTVPAIWSDSAKKFMREAAEMVGIPSSALNIALESEAAALHCLTAPKDRLVCTGQIQQTGARFLVIDIGGGTVDVTALQVTDSNSFVEIYKASGGAWGGTKVDNAFIDYLATLFSEESILEVKKNHPSDYVELIKDFEDIKKKVTRQSKQPIVLKLIRDVWNEEYFHGLSIEDRKGAFITKASRLKIPNDVIVEMISTVSKMIRKQINFLLKKTLKDLDYIVMVGGFSNCSIVVDDIKDLVTENKIPIIVPEEAELAVVKGAVLFSWRPDAIEERKCKHTYGIGKCETFQEGHHPQRYAFYTNSNTKMCEHIFDTLVTANDDIKLNERVRRKYYPINNNQTEMTLPFYVSDKDRVRYTDENDVEQIGSLIVPMPDTSDGMDREVAVDIFFGDTELCIRGKDLTSGKSVDATISFCS